MKLISSFLFRVMASCILAVSLAACDGIESEPFNEQVVVQGYLYAGEPVDSVLVSRTVPTEEAHPEDYVSGAFVSVTVDGVEHRFRETNRRYNAGVYLAPDSLIAEPGKTYHLRVLWNGHEVTASTTVPAALRLDSVKYDRKHLSLSGVDTIVYPMSDLSRRGVELWWTDFGASFGYGLQTLALDTAKGRIIRGTGGGDPTGPDSSNTGRFRFFISSKNEQIVWNQFRFYGPNRVSAVALDENLQEFVLGLYLGGSQFNNGTLRVNGGLGIWGSLSRASAVVYIKKEE